jgi:hypothetical protein
LLVFLHSVHMVQPVCSKIQKFYIHTVHPQFFPDDVTSVMASKVLLLPWIS